MAEAAPDVQERRPGPDTLDDFGVARMSSNPRGEEHELADTRVRGDLESTRLLCCSRRISCLERGMPSIEAVRSLPIAARGEESHEEGSPSIVRAGSSLGQGHE